MSVLRQQCEEVPESSDQPGSQAARSQSSPIMACPLDNSPERSDSICRLEATNEAA